MHREMEHTVALVDGKEEVGFDSLPQALKWVKKRLIEEALESCEGNRTWAAKRLGISRSNLQHTIRRLDVN